MFDGNGPLNQRLLIILLGLSCLAVSCASYQESLVALEVVHREPAMPPGGGENPMHSTFMEYADMVGEEVIDEPIEYCLDNISVIKDHSYGSEVEKNTALFVLDLTARRSPSQVVRSASVRAVRLLYTEDMEEYDPPTVEPEPEPFQKNMEQLRLLFNKGAPPDGRTPEEEAEYVALIDYLGVLALDPQGAVWKEARWIFLELARNEESDEAEEAFESAARRLNDRAAFRLSFIGLIDPAEVVRQEAIDLFFLFPWDYIKPLMAASIDRNQYLKAPTHSIHILMKLKLVAKDPETLGTAALGYAVKTATQSANPGAVFHAKALLKQVTGLDEDNPGFWINWWAEYLPEHAGE
jgi:hypothetical protein